MHEPHDTPAGAGTGEPDGAAATAPARPPLGEAEVQALEERVVQALRTVYDPEIPVNIYELGMIYHVGVEPTGDVAVKMTLTSPMCPVAGSLPGEVQQKIGEIDGVASARVELVWEPPWEPGKMTEAAKLQLGMSF